DGGDVRGGAGVERGGGDGGVPDVVRGEDGAGGKGGGLVGRGLGLGGGAGGQGETRGHEGERSRDRQLRQASPHGPCLRVPSHHGPSFPVASRSAARV